MKKIAVTALVLLAFACTPFKPAVSNADINTLTEYKVKGRQGLLINQKLSFGEYQTTKVKRSWTKGANSRSTISVSAVTDILYPEILTEERVNRNQTFSFQMSDAFQNKSDVFAASDFEADKILIGNNPNSVVNVIRNITGKDVDQSNMFYAQIYLNQNEKPWELVLDNYASQKDAKQYAGFFSRNENQYYILKPITQLQTSKGPKSILMGSVGFEICSPSQKTVAAVSLMDNGLVYMAEVSEEERFLLANLCAVLLLQQDVAE